VHSTEIRARRGTPQRAARAGADILAQLFALANPSLTITAAPPSPDFRLSVVIPTYNRRDLVLRAMASVLDQDASRQVQIVVADDGSTDGTAQAIAQRYGDDARVQVVVTARAHASAARNAGFAATSGDFICFLDSDDYWLPHTLATVRNVLSGRADLSFLSVDGDTIAAPDGSVVRRLVAEDSPGWSHAQFSTVDLARESVELPDQSKPITLLTGDFFPAIIHGDLFYLSAMVMRRQAVVGAGGFTERFRYFNDWEFFARLCLQGRGAYLDFDGFRRDTGRGDQISRRRPITSMPRRRLFILRSLPRRFGQRTAGYVQQFQVALDDAQYFMARCLVQTPHRRWARRYLARCLRRRYKIGRSVVLWVRSFMHPGTIFVKPRGGHAPNVETDVESP
jgi:glycosyltransferase involved in cell wall biosynthesis